VISNGNKNENCFKERSKIISRAAKKQVYKILIRSVGRCGAETWTITVVEENALRIFEREIICRTEYMEDKI
jgi:hypothetical protein